VREIDDRKIGSGRPGPITKEIQSTFFQAVHGELKQYQDWISYL